MSVRNPLRLSATALLCASTAAAPLWAQSENPLDLGLVILSGGLAPIAEADLQRSFTTIDAEEIAAEGHDTVLDVLRTVPGFQPSTGGLNSFRIRGADATFGLVLIDGVEVGLGSSGTFDLGNLAVGDIARVEVLRGPQSAAFGANAASGVVNIVTRGAPDALGTSGRIGIELADDGGMDLALSVATRGERGFLALNFARNDSGGYDIANEGGDEDRDRATAVTLKGAYDVTEDLTVGLTLRNQTRRGEFDGTGCATFDPIFCPAPFTRKEDYVIDGDGFSEDDSLSGEVYALYDMVDGRLQHRLSYAALDQQLRFPTFGSESENERRKWAYRLSYGLDGPVDNATQVVIARLERETETYINQGFFAADEDRETTSVALEYRGSFAGGLDLQAGVRRDDPDAFETATSWNAAVGYALNDRLTLRASGGKGIVAPTMTEQFGVFNSGGTPFRGNEDLTPEILTGWDIGLDATLLDGDATLSVTYFEQQITDRIGNATTVVRGTTFNTVENLDGESNQRGLELAAAYRPTDTLSFDLAYTYTEATDPDGDRAERVPEHVLNLGARLETFGGRGDVWAQVAHVAGIADLDRLDLDTVTLDPYTLLTVGTSYAFMENAELYGRIENLTRETYEEQWGYQRDDRTLVVGFRSTF